MMLERSGPRIGILAIAGATLWVFWGSLAGPFHFDDNLFLENARVTDRAKLLDNLNPAQLRQLTYLTFHLNYRWGGTRPGGYHLVNLLIHVANILALWLLTTLLLRASAHPADAMVRKWLPLAAAALFALHPVQSEAVNYVYQRSTLLAAFFSLMSLAALLRASEVRRRRAYVAASALGYFLAVAGKETALVLPLVWVAHRWAFAKDLRSFAKALRRVLRPAIAAFLCMGALAAWALHNLQRSGEQTVGLRPAGHALQYFLAQIQVFASYLRLILWPSGLSVDPAFQAAAPLSIRGIACTLLLALVLALAVRLRSVNPAAALLAACFLIFLLPSSSFIPSADLMFEHRLYLAMTAGSVLMAWGLLSLIAMAIRSRKGRISVSVAAFAALLAAYSAVSVHRTRVWANDARLWQDAAERAPWNARAHYNLGVARLQGDRAGARQAFLRAVQLQPGHAASLYNLGWLEQTDGRFESATRYFQAAVGADPTNWQGHHSLGNMATLQGRFDEAMRQYREAIRLKPDDLPAYRSLATLEIRQGNPAAALTTLDRLRSQAPEVPGDRYLRAYALVESGRLDEAKSELLRIESDDVKGEHENLIRELRSRLGMATARTSP